MWNAHSFPKHRLAAAVAVCCLAQAQGPVRIRATECLPDLPFRDLASGRRFQGRGRVVREDRPLPAPPALLAGCLLPLGLPWRLLPPDGFKLLSFREAERVVRLGVSGGREPAFQGKVTDCAIEVLQPVPGKEGSWRSTFLPLQVDVRGMFPGAWERALPAGGDRSACAPPLQAFDVAGFQAGTWWRPRRELFVTYPADHVVRRITAQGEVGLLSGVPTQPGQIDSPNWLEWCSLCIIGEESLTPRFSHPTYLAGRAPRGGRAEILVSDSGNNLIRRIAPDGSTGTFAGSSGMAGHYDAGNPREALFNDPRGIAADGAGNVFVADRGNRVVRAIAADGAVTTLAGNSRLPGAEDGIGASARFTDLKGLAYQPRDDRSGTLFVLDGHAVRAIGWPEGLVVTLLGQVGEAGFADTERPECLRRPCLNAPAGIRSVDGCLYIADTGNHALRKADLAKGTLRTLVGDPGAPGTRWGLLRDAVPGPLGAAYAALGSPTALAPGLDGPGCWVVCAGAGLVEFHDRRELRDQPEVIEAECPAARPGEPTLVRFRIRTADGACRPTSRAVRYTATFGNPDGTAHTVEERWARSLEPLAVQGAFTRAGTGTVWIRCVTDQGVSAGTELTVPVQCH